MIDEKLVSDYIQQRSGKTRIYAIRGKAGKVSMADTYKPVKASTINRDLAVLKTDVHRHLVSGARKHQSEVRLPSARPLC
jgi:hypothetical protein